MGKADCHARAATIHSSHLIERHHGRHVPRVMSAKANPTAPHVTSNTSSTRAVGAPQCFRSTDGFLWPNRLVCGRGCSRLNPALFLSMPAVQRSPCRDRDYNSGDKRPHWSILSAPVYPGIGPPAWAHYRHPPASDKRDRSSPASHPRQRELPSSTPPHVLKSSVAP